jgi:hypothetical protein
MAIKFTNNAVGTLASSIISSATTINVTAGQGALFPSLSSDYFFATLIDSSNNLEIIKVTARSTDTLTVVRGQDGTSGRAYAAGDKIELRVTAQALTDVYNNGGVQSVNGSTGAVSVAPLTGTGTSGTWPISITGNAATATSATNATNATNSTNITNSGGWNVTPSGTKLNFVYNGVTVGSLDSSGNFIAKANVTAYGTP